VSIAPSVPPLSAPADTIASVFAGWPLGSLSWRANTADPLPESIAGGVTDFACGRSVGPLAV
jgi:hypothetical protein